MGRPSGRPGPDLEHDLAHEGASESGEPRAGLAASHGPTGTPEYDGDQHASNTLPIPP